MQFTRLRLNGFKSFVDPTDLVIARGLTGVVGPNGCGKSNLLEALRWVMGENRPTAMRGGGMDDVIFAGTSTRPARSFAEVSLTIDNEDRRAPAGFNDADVIDVARRITRDAGSAYRCNAREVRARDVQILFADASTGSHSPALVRQGQIAQLINARPKDRRRVLEEAAGISGLYQRRHEAELKLRATETNLERVEDVIDQLAQQLAQLARQARQAARYRALSAELRQNEGLVLYRRWKEADGARASADAALREALAFATHCETTARTAAAAREAADAALPPLREEDAVAAAILQKLMVEREAISEREARARDAIAGIESRLEQMRTDRAREAGLTGDARATMDRLARERADLETAGAGHSERLAEAEAAAAAAAEALRDREAALSAATEDAARLAARHQAAERLLTDSRATEDRAASQAAAARAAIAEADRQVAEAAAARQVAASAATAAQSGLATLEGDLAAAEAARAEAQSAEADARAARGETAAEVRALDAEVAALQRLVARAAGAGAQVLDEVTAARGYERALGAAMADDLKAPRLGDGVATGWADLGDYEFVPPLPDGVEPLADHVTAPDLLRRRLGQVGLVEPDMATALQPLLAPGQRLVSRAGDLWRWDGFRAAAADAPSAAAVRLEQRNRLAELQAASTAARQRAGTAEADHRDASARLAASGKAETAARAARKAADAALADAGRAHARAEADLHLAEGRVEAQKLAVARHDEAAAEARRQREGAEAQLAGLCDLAAMRGEADAAREAVEAARIAMLSRRAVFEELRREGENRTARLAAIAKEQASWANRLATADERIADLDRRLEDAESELRTARSAPDELVRQRDALTHSLAGAQARRAAAADAVAAADATLRDAVAAEREAERAASDAREARAGAQARQDAAVAACDEATARIADAADTTPAGLLESLAVDPDDMPALTEIEATIARLRRSRDALGAVNLRAEEDTNAVQAEHDRLLAEKADLEAATAKLRAGINGLNREGRERLLTAFEQVNANFATLFRHLFGGGEARLELVESDDPLDAGLDILCQPPGKKLASLSLLSGGEQTLTALSLIFAVFLANPAPICVLDEVDAPLDDANVARFCDLLDEMARRTDTRFLIITHHAVTMGRMDRLFGVTMAEQGVSQLVSVDLKSAEQMVA